jgi:hypothetical protein
MRVGILFAVARLLFVSPEPVPAATIITQGGTLNAGALPEPILLPDGEPVSATDALLKAWSAGVRDDDVVLWDSSTLNVYPSVDFGSTVCAVTQTLSAGISLFDPVTQGFSPFGGSCEDLSAIINQPGGFAVVGDFYVANGSDGAVPTATVDSGPTNTPTTTVSITLTPSPSEEATPTGSATETATLSATPTTPPAGTPVPSVTPAPTVAPCAGDCGLDRRVTVDELLEMVNIALGNAPATDCAAGDPNGDEQITVDEILTALTNALAGCP